MFVFDKFNERAMSSHLLFVQYGGLLLGSESQGVPVVIMCNYSKGHAMPGNATEEALMIQLIAIHGTLGNRGLRIRELFCRLPCSLYTDIGGYLR